MPVIRRPFSPPGSRHFRAGDLAAMIVIIAAFLAISKASPAALAATGLDSKTAADGLKEALGVGATKSVGLLGRPDGYLKNIDVRIPMPEKLQFVEKSLRTIGRGDLVEEFVTSMNGAAEAAAPLAKEVFLDTIKKMSFEDALRIVRGKDHEATDYLRTNSGPKLGTLFSPIVSEQLGKAGATRSFDAMMSRASKLPFAGKNTFSLEEYVTARALDGLFLMIGREEEKIRKDPVARTTSLLKTVFGAPGESGKKSAPWWKKAISGGSR